MSKANAALVTSLTRRFKVSLTDAQASELRRLSNRVNRFDECLCGTVVAGVDVLVEHDEESDTYTERRHYGTKRETRRQVTDPRPAAIKRAAELLKPFGLAVYHQGDCRGVSLYAVPGDMTAERADQLYPTHGVALY